MGRGSRQKRTEENNVYIYRPFDSDPGKVRHMLEVWAGIAVDIGYDITGLDQDTQKRIAAEARAVFEAMGLLPDGFQPAPEDGKTTRPKCTHMKCRSCERCHCDGVHVHRNYCAECTWRIKQESGQRVTTAKKGHSGKARSGS